MKIREATPSDADAIREVHFESITELGPAAYDREQVDAWARGCESADYSTAIESDSCYVIVAEKDGDILAFGSLNFDAPEEYRAAVEAEVTGVYVHPSVVREGVGSAILTELERRARERDVRTLGLTSSLNAVPFYESRGYERVRAHAHEFSASASTGVEGRVVEMKTEP